VPGAARRPPGPAARWGIPGLLATRRDQLEWLRRMKARYGDVVEFRVWDHRFVQLNRADLLERVLIRDARHFTKGPSLRKLREVLGEGLLTSEGELHARQRRALRPAFGADAIDRYGARMIPSIVRACEGWSDGQVVCMYEEMKRLTVAIIGQVLFALDIDRAEAGRIDRLACDLMALLHFSADPLPALLRALGLPAGRRYESARQALDALIEDLLRRCDRERLHEHDPVRILGDAASGRSAAPPMTPRQVHDETSTLLFTGYEPASLSLAWAWHLISVHPEVQARLHAEVAALPWPVRNEHLPRLDWTRQVIRESLRLYPPGFALMRGAAEDREIDGYAIPAGTSVVMSQYLVQRDARYYDEPEAFRPERWTPGLRSSLPRCAYLPFGAGPRVCMGEPLAWREMILIVANVARRWRVEQAPGHRVEIAPRFHLYPKHGVRTVLRARD